jgi:hypothetical protein
MARKRVGPNIITDVIFGALFVVIPSAVHIVYREIKGKVGSDDDRRTNSHR